MKWFKHLVDSGDDPDIGVIIGKFGFEGYYLFFRTLEIMAREFDVESPAENVFDFGWFSSRLRREISEKTIVDFFELTSKLKRIFYAIENHEIWLNCPKLKELADEYTTKLLAKKTMDENPDSVGIKSGDSPVQRSKNKKKNKKKNNKDIIRFQKKIINYFNKVTKQHRLYTCSETNKLINGRLDEGRTFKDFKHVIDTKTTQWFNDNKMRKFLRPSTLFRQGNFEDYLNEPYEDPYAAKLKTGQTSHEATLKQKNFYEARKRKSDELFKKYKAELDKARNNGNKKKYDEIQEVIKAELVEFTKEYYQKTKGG